MEVDADDTGVLIILFLVNVASLRHEEEKLLKMWGLCLEGLTLCPLTGEYENVYSKLTMSPNTNHHNTVLPPKRFDIFLFFPPVWEMLRRFRCRVVQIFL